MSSKLTIEDLSVFNDIETSYECRYCPQCSATNWAPGVQHIQGVCCDPTEVIRCWNCKLTFFIDDYGSLCNLPDDQVVICNGLVNPSIPSHYLQMLVDISEIQLASMERDAPKECQCDIDELKDAIQFIKNNLADI